MTKYWAVFSTIYVLFVSCFSYAGIDNSDKKKRFLDKIICPNHQHSVKNEDIIKVVLLANPVIYTLSDLGIRRQGGIIYHTGFCKNLRNEFVVPVEGAVIVYQHISGKNEIYVIRYHDELSKDMTKLKDTITKSSTSSVTECKDALDDNIRGKLQAFLNGDYSHLDFKVFLYPKKGMGAAESYAEPKRYEIPFQLPFSSSQNSWNFVLRYGPEDKLFRKNKDYLERDDTDFYQKAIKKETVSNIKAHGEIFMVIHSFSMDVKTCGYSLYQRDALLYAFHHGKYTKFYKLPLPRSASLKDEKKRFDKSYRIRPSPKHSLFLNQKLIGHGGGGSMVNLMVLYWSDENTVSIAFRPDGPCHYSYSKNAFDAKKHNGCWKGLLNDCWDQIVVKPLEPLVEKNAPRKNKNDSISSKKKPLTAMKKHDDRESVWLLNGSSDIKEKRTLNLKRVNNERISDAASASKKIKKKADVLVGVLSNSKDEELKQKKQITATNLAKTSSAFVSSSDVNEQDENKQDENKQDENIAGYKWWKKKYNDMAKEKTISVDSKIKQPALSMSSSSDKKDIKSSTTDHFQEQRKQITWLKATKPSLTEEFDHLKCESAILTQFIKNLIVKKEQFESMRLEKKRLKGELNRVKRELAEKDSFIGNANHQVQSQWKDKFAFIESDNQRLHSENSLFHQQITNLHRQLEIQALQLQHYQKQVTTQQNTQSSFAQNPPGEVMVPPTLESSSKVSSPVKRDEYSIKEMQKLRKDVANLTETIKGLQANAQAAKKFRDTRNAKPRQIPPYAAMLPGYQLYAPTNFYSSEQTE